MVPVPQLQHCGNRHLRPLAAESTPLQPVAQSTKRRKMRPGHKQITNPNEVKSLSRVEVCQQLKRCGLAAPNRPDKELRERLLRSLDRPDIDSS